jgi:type I restriction enzyme M protein
VHLGPYLPTCSSSASNVTILPRVDTPRLNWLANFIWGIADDVLRDLYVRGKYRDMKASLDKAKVVHQDPALRQAAGQAFYNISP